VRKIKMRNRGNMRWCKRCILLHHRHGWKCMKWSCFFNDLKLRYGDLFFVLISLPQLLWIRWTIQLIAMLHIGFRKISNIFVQSNAATKFLLLCIQGPLVENAVACLVEMLHIMLLNNRYTAVYWFTYFEFMTKSFKLRTLIQVCETFLVSNPRSMWNITCIAFMGWHNNV
jgi:hypothetical protein